jgi:MFS family permease
MVTARRAVGLLFIVNAAAFANVVPRLPDIKAELGLSNTSLGTAVAAMPAGALLAGPAIGWLVARYGSARVASACGVAFGFVLPGFALAPSWGALAAVFLVLGALDSVMDVSMNAHALRVQRGFDRSIINALHGMWSIGAVLGGIAGTAAAGADADLGVHLVVAGAVVIGLMALARPRLLPGPDDVERASEPERAAGAAHGRRLMLLGAVVGLAAIIEDAPQSWGAVLLRTELEASSTVAGLVFIAFQASMTLGRVLGDRVVDRLGEVRVVRVGGLMAAAGVGAGLLIGEPAAVIVGFAVAGLGTATLFPLVFHAAGNLPGLATGHGVAAAAWMGRVGFLVAPPLVGAVGDALDLRVALVVVPVSALAVAVLAGAVAPDPSR